MREERKEEHKGWSRREAIKASALAGGALAGLPAFLAACGGGSQSSASSSGKSSGAGHGGSVNFGVVGDVANFDPYQDLFTNFIVMQNLNAFLVNYTSDQTPLPGAAQSWSVASDHKSVTLHLRKGIKFQTGGTFSSSDLVYGFERAQNPKQGGNLLSPTSVIAGSHAVDDATVVVEFKQAISTKLMLDIFESIPIVQKSDNNATFLAKQPAGAGPFKLTSWAPNQSVQIAPYSGWMNSGYPYLSSATFTIFDKPDTLMSALQGGSIDGAMYLAPKDANSVRDQFNIVQGVPGGLVNLLRINPSTPPFDNKFLRQAIQRAIDRERIVKEVLYGFAQQTVLPWGPHSPAYDSSYLSKYAFDLSAAKQLWIKAGRPSSGTAIASSSNTVSLLILQIIQSDLKKIGFNLQIQTQDSQTWLQNLLSGRFGVVIGAIGNSSKYPTLFVSNSLFRTSSNPLWGSKLPASYVQAIQAAEGAITTAQQQAAFSRLNAVLTDEAWGLGIATYPTIFGLKKTISGFATDVDDRVILEKTSVS